MEGLFMSKCIAMMDMVSILLTSGLLVPLRVTEQVVMEQQLQPIVLAAGR